MDKTGLILDGDEMDLNLISGDLGILTKAVEASRCSLIITDYQKPDHPIIFCNPAFELMTGYTREEIIGRNCRFLQAADRDQPAVISIRQAIDMSGDCSVCLRNYRKDGTIFWNELILSPIRGNEGQITHFIGIQQDITERMNGKNIRHDFVNLVSHEMRTPLTTIKGTLQVLNQQKAVATGFREKSIAAALKAVTRLEELGKSLFN